MNEKRRVQEALNRSLSGLRADPSLAQRVIAEAKGEQKVKKHISRGLILVVVLSLALIGTAYAAFSPQVADFFARHWGSDLGQWLENGRVAQLGGSIALGPVTLTLDEVVYRNHGLYGLGTVRALNEKDLLVAYDDCCDPEWFAMSEACQALAAKARETGSRLVTVECLPCAFGVDGGELLPAGSVGIYDLNNEDGSVTFSFEAVDGYAIGDGEQYTVQIEAVAFEVGQDGLIIGEPLAEVRDWQVTFRPARETREPKDQTAAETVIPAGDYPVETPEAYRETGTLPVYRAVKAALNERITPEKLNQSGIAREAEKGYYVMNDQAEIFIEAEGVGYYEFEGENKQALSAEITRLAARAHRGWPETGETWQLEKTELPQITLADARGQAEALLDELGIDDLALTYALDMSRERVRELGGRWNQSILEGKVLVDDGEPLRDYAQIPEAEEGFYLLYKPQGIDAELVHRREAEFFINGRGVVYISITMDYLQGEIVYTPETLITPRQAVERLAQEEAMSRDAYGIRKIIGLKLSYCPVRADDKAEGMVLAPVWEVSYYENNESHDWECRALLNAVDGSLIEASFLY